jgi:hypothetical protein
MSRSLLFALIALPALPLVADAHNIGVECKLKGQRVHVAAFYDDDTPGSKAKVTVLDAADKVVAIGVTDANGEWSFTAPAAGQYEVRIDAGAGHRAKQTIVVPPGIEDGEPSESSTISAGPSRAELTSFPWLKVAIGLTAIGALGGGYLVARLLQRHTP